MSFRTNVIPRTPDLDDEDEDWLLPPPKDNVTIMSIEELLKDVRLSENAGTLSRKIAKHQKRAVRRQNSVASLSSVAEEEREIGSFAPCLELTPPPDVIPICDTNTVHGLNVGHMGNGSAHDSSQNEISSNVLQATSCPEEEDFFDASDEFSEEALQTIIQGESGNDFQMMELYILDNLSPGHSLARPNMAKSLVKVEEEEPTMEWQNTLQPKRQTRSASVSPRQQINQNNVTPANRTEEQNNDTQNRSRFSRNTMANRSLGSMLKNITPIRPSVNRSTATARSLFTPEGANITNGRVTSFPETPLTSKITSNEINGVAKSNGRHFETSTPRKPAENNSSPQSLVSTPRRATTTVPNLHQSLQSVQDLAAQQEEALREEVLRMQQEQQMERKHSWQGQNSQPRSASNSMVSLASSKSVDIGTLSKTPSRPAGTSSKLPRPSGIPMPTKVSHPSHRNPITCLAKRPSNFDEDECF